MLDRRWLAASVAGGLALTAWLLVINRSLLGAIPGDHLLWEFGLAAVTFAGIVVIAVFGAPRVAAAVVLGIVVVELLVLAPHPFAERRDPYTAPAWVDALRHELAGRPTDRVFALDALLYPNTAAAYGLYDIRMLDALYSARYVRYLETFIVPGFVDRFAGSTIGSNEGESAYIGNPMFDLMGVRWVTSTTDIASGSLGALLPPGAFSDLLNVRQMVVDGEPKTAIFEHATNEVPLVLAAPVSGELHFSYGVDDYAATRGTLTASSSP